MQGCQHAESPDIFVCDTRALHRILSKGRGHLEGANQTVKVQQRENENIIACRLNNWQIIRIRANHCENTWCTVNTLVTIKKKKKNLILSADENRCSIQLLSVFRKIYTLSAHAHPAESQVFPWENGRHPSFHCLTLRALSTTFPCGESVF